MKKYLKPYDYQLANLLHMLTLICVLIFVPIGIAIGFIDYKLVPIENEFGQVVGTTFAFNTAAMLDVWLYGLISMITFSLSAFIAEKLNFKNHMVQENASEENEADLLEKFPDAS